MLSLTSMLQVNRYVRLSVSTRSVPRQNLLDRARSRPGAGPHAAWRAGQRYSADVSNSADDAVGELTIADATLCHLLCDILREVGGRNSLEMTTGRASDRLLALAKEDAALFTSDVTDWLKRVKKAAEKRNKVVHAIARDRCFMCGQATQFEHRGTPVDRSPAGVRLVTSECTALINNGVNIAVLISDRLNAREIARAQALAVSTGDVQTPKQLLIGQNSYLCATCSPTGVPAVTVSGVAAVVVLPPQARLDAGASWPLDDQAPRPTA